MLRKYVLLPVVLVALIAGAVLYVQSSNAVADLAVSGTIEARNIRVGSKVGGRVAEVLVREGDRVEPGQVLLTFDDDELEAVGQGVRHLEQALLEAWNALLFVQGRDDDGDERAFAGGGLSHGGEASGGCPYSRQT